jgi:uncharacterized RDD family membrane protein YckC/Flp pilus assembly protein TadD
VSEDASIPAPSAAPLGKRLAAGAFDFCVVWALVVASFLVPLFFRGLVLPMWGVLLVMIGYQVVPLSAFRQTLGMKIFGVELVTRAGHAVGPGEVLFRELVARGYFPAAFLGTIVLGLLAQLFGVMAFVMPTGIGAVFFLVSGFAFALAVLGHFLVFNRSDGRTLADLIARSYVTEAKKRPPPDDAEEAAFIKSLDRRRVRNVAIFEVLCIGLVFFGPWLLTQRTEGTGTRAARLKLRAQEEKAKSAPDDMVVLRDLYDLQRALGQTDEARGTREKMDALYQQQEAEREVAMRKRLLAEPSNRDVVGRLIDYLEDRNRTDEAREVYAEYVKNNPRPSLRAGFADWLADREQYEQAIEQLKLALAEDPELGGGHTLLGQVYESARKPDEAHREYYLAHQLDAGDDDATDALARLDTERGPLAKDVRKALDKQAKDALAVAAAKEPK